MQHGSLRNIYKNKSYNIFSPQTTMTECVKNMKNQKIEF